MGKVESDIQEGLEKIAAKFGPSVMLMGKVLSINTQNHTLQIELQNEVVIDDVRLKSVIKDGNYQIVHPSINSNILIGKIDKTEEWVLVAYESIDAFCIKIGTNEFLVSADGLEVKKGGESLKQVLQDLIQAIQTLTVTCAPAGSLSTPPTNAAAFTAISSRLNTLLK